MRTEEQTSMHLLLASIITVFGVMLIFATIVMSWESWMIPIIVIGSSAVWCLHIGRSGSNVLYENLCIGLLMIGFFFFAVHQAVLFEISAVACMLVLIFSMFDRKRLLYMTIVLYLFSLLYHFLLLHTISLDMGYQNMVRLGIGGVIVFGAAAIARYRIN